MEQKSACFSVNEQAVRELLEEHGAPFPGFCFVSPKDWRLNGHGYDRPALAACINYYGSGGKYEVCVQSGKFCEEKELGLLHETLIHELRHWWQYANPKEMRKLVRQRALKNIAHSLVVLICLILVGSMLVAEVPALTAGLWLGAVIYVIWLIKSVRQLVVPSKQFIKQVCERNASSFAARHAHDRLWVGAVRVWLTEKSGAPS